MKRLKTKNALFSGQKKSAGTTGKNYAGIIQNTKREATAYAHLAYLLEQQ